MIQPVIDSSYLLRSQSNSRCTGILFHLFLISCTHQRYGDTRLLKGPPDYQLGQSGGLEQATLSVSELPSHTHTFTGTQTRLPTSSQAPNTNSPDGSVPPTFPSGPSRYFDQQGDQTGMDINESLTLGVTGGSQAHENRSPFLGMTI